MHAPHRTAHEAAEDAGDGGRHRSTAPSRVLRPIFWNDDRHRARVIWLILLPVVGAYAALVLGEVVAAQLGLPVQVGFALFSFAALVTVVALVRLSNRRLGGRSLQGYGFVIDRRWRADLTAGLVIGFVAVAIPSSFALALGWVEIGAFLDAGDLALVPGFAVVAAGLVCVGIWEEVAMRGVFLCNAADGFRAWLSPRRAVAAAIGLSGIVFGLAHIAQPQFAPLILTWVLAGVVLGGVYVLSGNLALPIGAHITFNMAHQMVFLRTDAAGAESFSAILRLTPDPTLAFLQTGGILDIANWIILGLLTHLWLRLSRGTVRMELGGLGLGFPSR